MLGQVYASAGLHSDAEACLRQSLRKVCNVWLPRKSGSERREGGPATCIEEKGEEEIVRGRREDDVNTLGAVYLELKQFDHAEALLHASMPADPTSKSKLRLASMYLDLEANSKRVGAAV